MDDGALRPLFGSDPNKGLEQTIGLLVQQQAKLMTMQHELRTLVEYQHKQLERRLADLTADQLGGRTNGAGDEDQVDDEAENSETARRVTDRAVPGLFKKFSNNKNHAEETTIGPTDSVIAINTKFVKRMATAVVSNPYFEVVVGSLIIFHFMILFSELQYRREDLAFKLRLQDDDSDWSLAKPIFKFADKIFAGIYLFEWLLRLIVVPRQICGDLLGAADTAIIWLASLHAFILDPLVQGNPSGVMWFRAVRLLRVIRLFRILRVLRVIGAFSALRIFVNTIVTSIQSLLWSMFLVSFIIVTAAMVMNELTAPYIEDGSFSHDMRLWLFSNFGSSGRASYSMFEATFSGKWATQLGPPLVDHTSAWFCLFWVLYVVFINFAVIRVIAALFLKQTMDVAKVDAERIEAARMREREKVMGTLREIFRVGDTSGDGMMTRDEFDEMMKKDEVSDMFESIDLEPPELFVLFHLLAEDDGAADQEEFLTGAMCLKNPVRNMDLIRVLHGQLVMRKALQNVEETLRKFPKYPRLKALQNSLNQTPCHQSEQPHGLYQL